MDIDIDFRDDFEPESIFPECIRASMIQDKEIRRHNAGVYFQKIPVDQITNLAAIPFKEAEELGYIKVDFLHLPAVLNFFESKDEIKALLKKEPDWNLLLKQEVVEKLFQIHNHFDLILQVKPKSIEELADAIALIRPAKRPLLKKYLQDKEKVKKVLYMEPSDGSYYYKRPHAIAYAHNIVLQLHLIKGEIL